MISLSGHSLRLPPISNNFLFLSINIVKHITIPQTLNCPCLFFFPQGGNSIGVTSMELRKKEEKSSDKKRSISGIPVTDQNVTCTPSCIEMQHTPETAKKRNLLI